MATLRTICNRDCPDSCGVVATVEGGRVVRLAGDREHPVTRGFLCYRTNRFLERQYSPERLTSPLMRKGGVLVPVGWHEALDFVAGELVRVRREFGAASIVHYRSGGSLGLLKALTDYFFSLFGPVTVKRGDICSGAGEAAQCMDFGDSESSDLFTLLRSKHILLWGKNLVTSSPHTLKVVRDARARGSAVVLIDPVHHATVKHADRYLQPRPGGDLALALAVGRTLFERHWCDPAAATYCNGLEAFRALCSSRSIDQWCSEADVTDAEVFDLAERLRDGPTAIVVGWGMGRRTNGGAIVRALDALGAISGNVGVSGGGVSFYFKRRGAFDFAFTQAEPPPRTISEPLFGPELLALRDPPVRAVWVTCGNPVTMLPQSETTARALSNLDLVVVVDSFLTDTARLATVVFPTTTLLEADDIVASYGHHFIGCAEPVVPPPEGVLSDLEIVQGVAERVGLGVPLAGTAEMWKRRLLGAKLAPAGVALEDLRRGVVRNPFAPKVAFADRRFSTPSGKVELLNTLPLPLRAPPPDFPMWMLSVSTPRSQSSQWVDGGEVPPLVTVHPEAASGLPDGSEAYLESRLGRLRVRVRHDPRQRPDVALIAKGGHRAKGACANSLLEARTTDLGEGGALYEQSVRLRA